jgi:hypothetical protein
MLFFDEYYLFYKVSLFVVYLEVAFVQASQEHLLLHLIIIPMRFLQNNNIFPPEEF